MPKSYKKIILLKEVESTNNYAKQLIAKGTEDYTVVLAQYQKKGKGQLGNSWESEFGKNMLASIILFPDFLEAGKQFLISKIVSLALVNFLQTEIGNVKIKWPNDIYAGEKKIAGILIENSIKGRNLDSSIVGIGLNLNQTEFVSDAVNPISLKQLTGKNYNIENVLNEIFAEIRSWYLKLKNDRFTEIDEKYFSCLFRNGGMHLFRKDGVEFEAEIIGIGTFGHLQLKEKTENISEFMFREVEFVLGE